MTGKTQVVWLLQFSLALVLLIGLYAMPPMFMQAKHMSMTSEANTVYGKASGEHSAPTPCCNDMFGSLSLTCGVIIPHCAYMTHFVGTQRVAFSPFFGDVTYRNLVTPPPKI